ARGSTRCSMRCSNTCPRKPPARPPAPSRARTIPSPTGRRWIERRRSANSAAMSIERLAQLADPAAAPRVVVKVGSALLVGEDGQPRRDWLRVLAAELATAISGGQQVIVVTSGAI